MTKAPASKLRIGVVRTLPKPPRMPSSASAAVAVAPSAPAPWPRAAACLRRACCCSFCIPGSATIHGCTLRTDTPMGTSARSRSSIASVNVQSGGSGASVGRIVESRERVARNWEGRFCVGGGGLGKGRRAAGGAALMGGLPVLLAEALGDREKGMRCSDGAI